MNEQREERPKREAITSVLRKPLTSGEIVGWVSGLFLLLFTGIFISDRMISSALWTSIGTVLVLPPARCILPKRLHFRLGWVSTLLVAFLAIAIALPKDVPQGASHAPSAPSEADLREQAIRDEIELEPLAKQAVANMLKDPDAAKFRNLAVKQVGKNKIVCGEVNGKNSFGAYIGYRPFFSLTTPPMAAIDDGSKQFVKLWQQYCR